MHSGTSQNTRNIATVAYNLGFDLAVVDVVGEQKNSVNLKFPGKLTVSAGIGESRKWLIGESSLPKSSGQANTTITLIMYTVMGM
jgi:hypothetical protein